MMSEDDEEVDADVPDEGKLRGVSKTIDAQESKIAKKEPKVRITNQLTPVQEWEEKEGTRFFTEPQTVTKNLRHGVNMERLVQIRNHFLGLKTMLQEKLQKLEEEGESADLRDEEGNGRISIELNLWVIIGFLDHNLSLHRLEKVAANYKRI